MLMAIQMPIQFQDESVSVFFPLSLSLVRSMYPRTPTSFHLPPYAEPFLYYSCPLYISTLAISSVGTTLQRSDAYTLCK